MKRELPGEIVTRVVEGLLSTNLVAGPSPAHVPTGQSGPLDDRMTEALERVRHALQTPSPAFGLSRTPQTR